MDRDSGLLLTNPNSVLLLDVTNIRHVVDAILTVLDLRKDYLADFPRDAAAFVTNVHFKYD